MVEVTRETAMEVVMVKATRETVVEMVGKMEVMKGKGTAMEIMEETKTMVTRETRWVMGRMK